VVRAPPSAYARAVQSTLILVDRFHAADTTAAGTRLSLPARVGGRLGRLVVSVERFEAAPVLLRNRCVRLLDADEFARVRDAIGAALSDSIRRQDLAALIGMSVSSFSRAFRASAGTTFVDYVLQARLETAKDLMRTTHSSLCEIAIASGFGNQSNFSRRFARAVGVTPFRWRAMYRHDV